LVTPFAAAHVVDVALGEDVDDLVHLLLVGELLGEVTSGRA
jgi:hypothetical protein